MKIVITGGGTGGDFYPLMAVADSILAESRKQTLVEPRLYYVGPSEFNPKELFVRGISYIYIPAGDRRKTDITFIHSIIDSIKVSIGCVLGLLRMFILFPDVVFAKGSNASFPTLFAAKVLGIPVILHESNTIPGKINIWAGKFAKRIAISFPESVEYFDPKKVAYTGNPVRKEISVPLQVGAYEYLGLDPTLPVVTVLGGSQGSDRINEILIRVIPELTTYVQVIHQTGSSKFNLVQGMSKLALDGATHPERYKPVGYMSNMVMRMIASISRVIISRAGSGLFEISLWGVPSILIPLTDSHNDHQRKNAYNYARVGGAVVIEEDNLTPQILIHELDKILKNDTLHDQMATSARKFARADAADVIAHEVLSVALSHEV